ncbi:hypothetical protein V6B33_01430 [Mangrovibacillus sp. Mu-81]|uniref:hypothetical protein n=1 Tax=Mangrovibacillus sp. Mu-81 TaxID=3121478 RepID=UPI002FE42FE8
MNRSVILFISLLVIAIIIICLYFISRHTRQATQTYTLESFINAHHLNNDESQKKTVINYINDFFDDNDNDGESDGLDDGDSGGGGNDSGE